MMASILFWTGVVGSIILIGWLTWKLAKNIDKADRIEAEWDEYLRYLDYTNPAQAAYYRWLQEHGEEAQYYPQQYPPQQPPQYFQPPYQG
jgi:NADH:ubiquinone oxidoreductase subunit